MKNNFIRHVLLFSLLPATAIASSNPIGNGTWAYDSLYNNAGKKIGQKPGLFANLINDYNLSAEIGHKITQVFSYGGDMEMYCQGSGESDPNETCTSKNMLIYYDSSSTTAYYAAAYKTSDPVSMVPIVDGRLDQKGASDLLSALNHLDQPTAELYADKVAALYCNDDQVSGIQFDIEPFDINQPGQAYFYQQIAKDLAGKNNPNSDGSDPLNCVNAAHPKGRFFSVFTFAKNVDGKVASVLNSHQNGYVVDSLYDLGPNAGGIANSPEDFRRYVSQEVQDMLAKAKQYNVNFQFAIPAAASAHEFESKAGKNTGYRQIDYVKAAFDAIDALHAKQDSHFLGMAIWAWNDRMIWHGEEYTPAIPSDETKAYLAKKL